MLRSRNLALTLFLIAGPMCSATSAQLVPYARLSAKTLRLSAMELPERIGSPDIFVGSDNLLALVDYSDMTIYRANAQGIWQSTFQKLGSGPGEIRDIGGMQFDRSGALWISDTPNSRISVRGSDSKLLREFKTSTPLRGIAPALGSRLVAITTNVNDLAVVLDSMGKVVQIIPFPTDIQALNPIARERFLVRINDSLSVVQFRWYNRRIALKNDGRIAYDSGSVSGGPEVLAMAIDQKGSTAYRIRPKEKAFALAVASRGDTLLVLLGSKIATEHGRSIVRLLASTGRPIDRVQVNMPLALIATTKEGLYAIGETDNGYALYLVRRN